MSFPFETQRLILRPFQDEDLETFIAYRSDPMVAQYQGWNAPYPRSKALAFIEEMKGKTPGIPDEWYQAAIGLKPGGEMIGDCAFHILPEDARQAEIGFTLAHKYWGYGYASEAVHSLLNYLFGEMGLHRVRAICDIKNTASEKVLKRLGMRREGHFIENVWFKGSWGSEYLYAILEQEWQQRDSC
jgi:RimJ/RimL family protein N-acetyltransferase